MAKIRELTTGIQHLGLPTAHYQETLSFYKGLGFEVLWQASDRECTFLKMGEAVIETYSVDEAHPIWGAWDHVALNVSDIDAAYIWIKDAGYTFAEGEDGPVFLPFFDNGVKFFTIIGPNNEKLEFNQFL